MQTAAKPISLVALAATIVPSVLYLTGMVDHNAVKVTALVGTVVWFVTTPLWMGHELPIDADQVEI